LHISCQVFLLFLQVFETGFALPNNLIARSNLLFSLGNDAIASGLQLPNF
jgi:hypothetical protein